MSGYQPNVIEGKWQQAWRDAKAFDSEVNTDLPKFYCLEMFPYPSGYMHMGHVRNYSIGDSMARFRRLNGFNVLYPMGYDSFGMPAENAAKKTGGHPHNVTWSNIESIRADLQSMGFSYDWRRELATSNKEYYKWNQWIFLKFHEMGLVERRTAPVNWCDECDTVLANEQVKNNRCWRCAGEVRQKDMAQWFLKMTNYADELLDDLEEIGFPENVKAMQRNWIGRSHGAQIHFPIADSNDVIETFTTRPDTIFGVTFVTLAPEHHLCKKLVAGTEFESDYRELADECARMSEFDRINMIREKKGVFLGKYATNPLTGDSVPIYAGNFVVASYGTGAVMAVPGHDQRDHDFAKKYNIPIKQVLSEEEGKEPKQTGRAFEGLGWMVNSDLEGFDGLYGPDAKAATIAALETRNFGTGTIQYRLKDWLLSRQRFWGTPIPFIHCDSCGVIPVPESDLPVELPLDVKFTEGLSGNPLASNSAFVDIQCPSCGANAKRETDTMDTFYDSSWYFLRFCDAMNDDAAFGKDVADYWMKGGVDLYIGGIEHAVMHLLYARFFTKALRDAGLLSISEPFSRLVCQGMVNAPTPFCSECNVEYHVDLDGTNCSTCGGALTSRSAKMSKSLGNTVSPEVMIEKYGADTVRLFILFGANPEAGMDWSDSAIEANFKQMNAIYSVPEQVANLSDEQKSIDDWILARTRANASKWNDAMMDVSLRDGVMISHFDMLSDWQWYLRRGGNNQSTAQSCLATWATMLYPATPHLAEEWWQSLGNDRMLAQSVINFSKPTSDDFAVMAKEEYLREVINSARNVRQLAERHSDGPLQAVVIQTTTSWKKELAMSAIRMHSEDFDFKQGGNKFLQTQPIFQNESMRADVMQLWRNLVVGHKKRRGRIHTYSQGQRMLITTNFDETEFLIENATFISNALDIPEVVIHVAGEGEDVAGKAKSSMPLEPGIAWR
ncbi:MAG: leucine--tRNA ligase [Candidatus Thermoplasmatota archaeon]|nr:leucine--tRNA ligase [Candidatus Thermoplasmatota archaeon]